MTVPIQNGPRYKQLSLWRDATRWLVAVEVAVRQFGKTPSPPRLHKTNVGLRWPAANEYKSFPR